MAPLRAVVSLACLCCAQGCSSFASSNDRWPSGEGMPPPPSEGVCRRGLSTPGCPGSPAFAVSSTPPLGTLPDAATSAAEPADASTPDAAAASAASRDAGASERCAGPGELLDPAGSRCYLRGEQPQPWAAARGACVLWGGDLARIESADEHLLLRGYLLADTWLGASDLSAEGEFTWVDDSPLIFSSWAGYQPDDFGGVEDCVEQLQRDGNWNDQRCTEPRAYFCERAVE